MHCFCCMAFCFALCAKLLRANRDESFLPIATSAVLNQRSIRRCGRAQRILFSNWEWIMRQILVCKKPSRQTCPSLLHSVEQNHCLHMHLARVLVDQYRSAVTKIGSSIGRQPLLIQKLQTPILLRTFYPNTSQTSLQQFFQSFLYTRLFIKHLSLTPKVDLQKNRRLLSAATRSHVLASLSFGNVNILQRRQS